ncbi:hypothetical protein [Micromonospora sp. KLBMP9576]|uniref:hypothetical protein n=1 Tax=Micromonospora sp. KLBMP9576 TaxID=3424769 RepID=UPI003D8EE60F
MPISYSPRTGQHHHHLRSYKSSPASTQAKWNLLALLLLFLRGHLDCFSDGSVVPRPMSSLSPPRGASPAHTRSRS